MKTGVLTAMIFALMVGFPIASMAGLAPDADSDGVPDVLDNCDLVANASPLDCDTNTDGYGNRCDADLNNGGTVTVQDFGIWRAAFQNPGTNLQADHNCSGTVTVQDFGLWRAIFQNPGNFSSGLSCAGTVPCS